MRLRKPGSFNRRGATGQRARSCHSVAPPRRRRPPFRQRSVNLAAEGPAGKWSTRKKVRKVRQRCVDDLQRATGCCAVQRRATQRSQGNSAVQGCTASSNAAQRGTWWCCAGAGLRASVLAHSAAPAMAHHGADLGGEARPLESARVGDRRVACHATHASDAQRLAKTAPQALSQSAMAGILWPEHSGCKEQTCVGLCVRPFAERDTELPKRSKGKRLKLTQKTVAGAPKWMRAGERLRKVNLTGRMAGSNEQSRDR
eukprot:2162349-Pleurochrysis_carterae.AAC.1